MLESYLFYYLVVINILGFILASINFFLYSHTERSQIDNVVTVITLLGGSLGILISLLLFGREIKKENMMSRVFFITVFIVQIILLLYYKGYHADTLSLDFFTFFGEHKALIIYLLIINLITFIAFAIDKNNAKNGERRIRNLTLLGLSLIGGSIGGIIAMYCFRHKTKKDYYTVGIPMIIIMQIILVFYLMNSGLK